MDSSYHSQKIRKLLEFLPERIALSLVNISWDKLEEIRLRVGQRIQLRFSNENYFVSCHAGAEIVTSDDCTEFLERICFHSVYACAAQLKSAFVTLPGGFRVGIAGKILLEDGRIQKVDQPCFFCIRIARECIGCADAVMKWLHDGIGRPMSALILAPPGCGKTTLLRDIARSYSMGMPTLPARCVCVIDERSEIAGCLEGIPQNDLGPRCDVLDNCPKAEGIMLALRALAPEVIVCDELGGAPDCAAIFQALNSGCAVYTTLHADSYAAFKIRFSEYSNFLFSRYILLSRKNGPGTFEAAYDQHGVLLGGRICAEPLQ